MSNIEELKRLAEAAIKANETGTYKEFAIARTAFGSVANPAAVLELIAEVERVTKQRDELLAALKDARRELAYAGRQEAHDAASAAIAKAEG